MRSNSIKLLIYITLTSGGGYTTLEGALLTGLGNTLSGRSSACWAKGVSDDGSVVVGFGRNVAGDEAFIWTQSAGMVGLGDLSGGGFGSMAMGVSGDGSTVVGFGTSGSVGALRWTPIAGSVSSGTEASRWTQPVGISGLGSAVSGSYALGVSQDGSVVVGQKGNEPFRWTQSGGMVSLGGVGMASGVSGDGTVVVGQSGSDVFRWTQAGGMMDLGSGIAYGVSRDGSVVVGQSGAAPFRWTEAGGMVSLGGHALAYGVSENGSVVVGTMYSGFVGTGWSDPTEAFYWTAASGKLNLETVLISEGVDLTGWDFNGIDAISANGRYMVGAGFHNGIQEAFLVDLVGFIAPPGLGVGSDEPVATVVPEPSTWVAGAMLLIPLGMSVIRMLRRKCRA